MAAAWLDGYRSVAPLTADDVRAACALSMLRRLTILGWTTTHREDALPPGVGDEYRPGTVEVAGRYLADRTWLAPGRPPVRRRPRPDGGTPEKATARSAQSDLQSNRPGPPLTGR